ncbi:hypothetical protein DFH06DRAFT_1188714 [Mycena polygramma]|nr:hypothetical protein DFH06DRAFT_1188714 [Mycena polygramma]
MSNPFPADYYITTTPMDQAQAVRLTQQMLGDPYCLPVCALPLLLPTMNFFDKKSGSTKVDTVWPTVMAFLTAKRTTEQFRQLQIQMNNCRCPTKMDVACKQQHDIGRKIYHDRWERMLGATAPTSMTPFHCVVFNLFAGLFDYLQPLSVTKTAKGEIKMWPRKPADLLPHGPDVTIQSLEQWLEHIPDPAPSALALLSQLIRLCRTLIVPSMVASNTLPALVVATIRRACAEAGQRMEAPWFSPQTAALVARSFNQRISYVELFLVQFSSRRTRGAFTSTEVSRFWGNEDKPFFESANAVLELYTRSRLFPPGGEKDPQSGGPRDTSIQIFREVTATMILDLNQKYGVSRDALESGAREISDAWEKHYSDPLFLVRQDLLALKMEERCSMVGCFESLQTSSKLRRCGDCKILCWCSKEHQKLAWKDPRYAHRDICKLMQKIVEEAGGDLNTLQRSARSALNISPAEVLQITAWIYRFRSLREEGLESVFHTLAIHLKRDACSAIDCPRARAEPGQGDMKFNRCSGCGVFQYCNAECQLKAWKDPKAPHKQVCKLIKRVIEEGGGDVDDFQKISQRMGEGLVSRPDLETIDDWLTRFNQHAWN